MSAKPLGRAAPIRLFAHLREYYGASVAGSVLRTTLLLIGTTVALLFLMTGLIWIGLAAMPDH